MLLVNDVRKHLIRVTAALLLVAGFEAIPPLASARLVMDKSEEANAPREVFGRIAEAWDASDEEVLASLVHRDGLKVTNDRSEKRDSRYSPSQAYYYFRNIFQAHRTLLFDFEMMQDAEAGNRVHALAVWKRRRPDSEIVQELKLVCTLVKEDDQWKLAEINTIR